MSSRQATTPASPSRPQAEVQLDARARQELGHEELREAIRSSALRIPEAERPDHLRKLTAWKPLSKAQKRELERYFDAERHDILDTRLARVLSYLHRYRNEAYHHARVRPETLRTAAAILFEADCDLLLEVYQVSYHSSAEDYSWLQDRFGIGRGIVDELRACIRKIEREHVNRGGWPSSVCRSGTRPSCSAISYTDPKSRQTWLRS